MEFQTNDWGPLIIGYQSKLGTILFASVSYLHRIETPQLKDV